MFKVFGISRVGSRGFPISRVRPGHPDPIREKPCFFLSVSVQELCNNEKSYRSLFRFFGFPQSAGGTDDEGSDEDMYPARTTTKRRRGGSMGAAGVTPSRGTKKTRMGGVEEGDEEEGEEEGEEGLDTRCVVLR